MSPAAILIDHNTPIEYILDIWDANLAYEAMDDLAMCKRFIQACGSLMTRMHRGMDHGSESLQTNSMDIPEEKHRAEKWLRHKNRKLGRHLFSTQRWRQF